MIFYEDTHGNKYTPEEAEAKRDELERELDEADPTTPEAAAGRANLDALRIPKDTKTMETAERIEAAQQDGTQYDLKNNIDFLFYHNKNLTKEQYNAVDDIRDTLKTLLEL